jgi:hypothetical protein
MKRSRTFQFFTCGMLTYLALFTGLQPSLQAQGLAAPQGAPVSDLTIKIIEGEDGVNIIQKKSAVKPVVQVVDKNNLPVGGATVVFALPSSGASASFAGGTKTLTVITNAAGRATASSMTPVGNGTFNISVTANFQGQVGTATLAQTNYLTVEAAQAAGVPSSAIAGAGAGVGGGLSTAAIVGIVAGVAAAAAAVAVSKSGGEPKGTIGIGGSPTLGPPR